ncbi:MAG: hypothetical protein MJ160_05375 [Treponema sp.]|nr:hypothetical protein [Treponema sp.]
MKKLIVLLLAFVPGLLYAQNFSLDGSYMPDLYSALEDFTIKGNTVEVQYKMTDDVQKIRFSKFYKSGLLYLKLSESIQIDLEEPGSGKSGKGENLREILVLAGKEIVPNENVNSIIFFGENVEFDDESPFISNSTKFSDSLQRNYYDCSSFLSEKNKDYDVENLSNPKAGTPWVEGVKGSGIGEGFTIKGDENSYLLIMNGYSSCEKPYLYKQNNRIKKIKVTGLISGKSEILSVLDTPHPQTVDISFLTAGEDIRVEVAEVYKGTKYDDTCVNLLVTYPRKVIPYEDKVK